MTTETLRELIADLSARANALAVLGAELEARASGRPIHPELKPHVDAILREIGAADALASAEPEALRSLATEIRHFWLVDGELLGNPDRPPGWTYTHPDVLATGGDLTAGFAHALAEAVAPRLGDLAARLASPDARFLDVGTGVGRLAIAIADRFPSLRAVGIDTWAPSLALARENVAAANLTDRIELRQQAAEDLTDESVFDLAWVPAPFIAPQSLAHVVERVHRALRPGGWVLFATAKPGDDLRGKLMSLRVASWGGRTIPEGEIEELLGGAGFDEIVVLPGPPKDFKMIVAGRRDAGS